MTFTTETERLIQQAIDHPVRSRHHEWAEGEQADYDSLKASGRSLYDNLRTQFNWGHNGAFTAAREKFGLKIPSNY